MRILIPLTEGFEEMEAVVPADLLIRGGVEALFVGLKAATVKGSHGISINCNGGQWEELKPQPQDFDGVFLPGGMPASLHLWESKELQEFVEAIDNEKKLVCAICAAPAVALAQWGLLKDRLACCYPGFEPKLKEAGAQPSPQTPCIRDGHIITGRGPGAAFDTGLAMIAYLKGEEAAAQLKEQVVYH